MQQTVNLGGVPWGCTFLERTPQPSVYFSTFPRRAKDAAKLYQQVVERYESGAFSLLWPAGKQMLKTIYFVIKIF